MKLKNLSYMFCGLLAIGMAGCSSKDDYIPPALEPPVVEKPDEPDVYNKPDYPLHEEGQPYDTYRGLVMAGYQGWHGAPGDGCKHNELDGMAWYHYTEGGVFKPGVLRNSIDLWPDFSEYEKLYTPGVDGPKGVSEKFMMPNGEPAKVYSSCDESTVMLHFKWMQQYGLDGVFMQRFVGEVIDNPYGKDHFDKVLENAMKASNKYQRAISVMYDLGGFMDNEKRGEDAICADAQAIMDKFQLKDRNVQKYYLYEKGKPLLALWGVGFDEKPFDADQVTSLIAKLRAQGWSIMLGVNDDWRTHSSEKWPRAKYADVVKSADIIFPWYVGRYNTIQGYEDTWIPRIETDVAWCKKNNVLYAVHSFAGYADRNMHPKNDICDRLGGKFLWDQLYNGVKLGVDAFYIAMFDEIDEGTAIYKCLNKSNVPNDKAADDYYIAKMKDGSYKTSKQPFDENIVEWTTTDKDANVVFQGYEDDVPTDHYLWLTGQGRKMFRGEVPLKKTWPERK